MKDKLIFEALKKDEEVWHHVDRLSIDEYFCDCGCILKSRMESKIHERTNPDFSTWLGFGWIMERLPEWDKMQMFFLTNIYIDDHLEKIDFDGFIPLELCYPTAMRDALIKFIEGE